MGDIVMSSLYESFLRTTNSDNIQEWFQDLKNLLESLEELPDPEPEDVQLAYHLHQVIENFELMESNLLNRRRRKNEGVDNLYNPRPVGSSVMFD
jgi:hypothetical protein